jgi:hypothetical protein
VAIAASLVGVGGELNMRACGPQFERRSVCPRRTVSRAFERLSSWDPATGSTPSKRIDQGPTPTVCPGRAATRGLLREGAFGRPCRQERRRCRDGPSPCPR